MYTSYFGNRKNIINPLAITFKPPFWFKTPNYPILAPKELFLRDYKNNIINEEKYVELFLELVLDPLNPEEIYNELIETYDEDVTLLCYEKPPKFCHRHIVSNWFENNLGVEVPELPF